MPHRPEFPRGFSEPCPGGTAAGARSEPLRDPARYRNAGAKRANEQQCEISELGITSRQVAQIVALREGDEIGSSAADTLFGLLCDPSQERDARQVAEEKKLLQVSDTDQLEAWITAAISTQPQAAADFASGKDAALGRLTGEVMKQSQGRADAKAVQEKLRERLRGNE